MRIVSLYFFLLLLLLSEEKLDFALVLAKVFSFVLDLKVGTAYVRESKSGRVMPGRCAGLGAGT